MKNLVYDYIQLVIILCSFSVMNTRGSYVLWCSQRPAHFGAVAETLGIFWYPRYSWMFGFWKKKIPTIFIVWMGWNLHVVKLGSLGGHSLVGGQFQHQYLITYKAPTHHGRSDWEPWANIYHDCMKLSKHCQSHINIHNEATQSADTNCTQIITAAAAMAATGTDAAPPSKVSQTRHRASGKQWRQLYEGNVWDESRDEQCKESRKYTAEVKAVMEDCPMNCWSDGCHRNASFRKLAPAKWIQQKKTHTKRNTNTHTQKTHTHKNTHTQKTNTNRDTHTHKKKNTQTKTHLMSHEDMMFSISLLVIKKRAWSRCSRHVKWKMPEKFILCQE